MSTVETKVNLFSVLPTPTVSTDRGQADMVNGTAGAAGKSFDSTLDKAREQAYQTDKPADKSADKYSEAAPAADKKPGQVKGTPQTEEPEDEVKAAVKSGEILTLLTVTQPVAAEQETEQPVQLEDPVANPVEAITAIEAIGQETNPDSGRTPLAMLHGSAINELLPDSTTAKADSSLLNQLSGRYEGEVTIGQQVNVPTGDAQNIEGLLVNTAGAIADDLAAMTAATASRALGLNQPQTDEPQTLMSRSELVVDNQVLDDSSALGLTNVKISEEAMSSLNQDKPQTPQQELSQIIVGMNEELKERLSNPQDDPEDKRTAIPRAILDGAAAKNPELYLTKTARLSGIRTESEDKSGSAAAGLSQQTQQIEVPQVEQEQPQTAAPADIYDIRQQIVEQVRMIRTAQTTELVMQLKPEHLGQLTMKVSVANNGAVTAVFQSENAQVRAAIESQLTQLKQELQQQGLKVDNVSVGAGLSEDFFTRSETQGQMSQFAQQQSQQAGTSGNGNRRVSGIAGIDEAEGMTAAENGSAAGVISTDAANPVNNATDTILDYRV
ncbi:MAG: flagellar hook-length control protein FliK [Selenomonadaceae bacterium]|nr:flagellar hook-length control protein FliK [Selenomonadaceae bacterium]